MVHNCTEEAVKRILPGVLKDYLKTHPRTCNCDLCQEDILALSLNQLPPHYVASEQGAIFPEVSFDQIGGKAQVIAAITRAINQVSENPRHKRTPF